MVAASHRTVSDGVVPSHPIGGRTRPHRPTAVVVGALFLFQLVTFMIGSSMIERYLSGEAGRTTMTIGVAFEMCAGLAVVAIGLLMYRILRIVDNRLAVAYPIMRIIEFATSALLAAYLLAQLEEFPNHLLWVYIPTGIGGLVLNYLFFVHRLTPRVISGLGLIGYSLLLLVVPLDLMGALDADRGAGLALLAPGGIYEFMVLPAWLIAQGFRLPLMSSAEVRGNQWTDARIEVGGQPAGSLPQR